MSRRGLSAAAVLWLAGCPMAREPAMVAPWGERAQGRELALRLPSQADGKPHDFASDRGHVVLLDVWATWCEPCKKALPIYQGFAHQYATRGLRVYAVSVDDTPQDIPAFLQQAHLDLAVLLDPGAETVKVNLGVQRMPTTFFVDKSGRVRNTHEGFSEDQVAQYRSELEALLAE